MENTVVTTDTSFEDCEDTYFSVLDKNGNSIAVGNLPVFFGALDQAVQFIYQRDPENKIGLRVKNFSRNDLIRIFRDGFQIMYREATAGPNEPFQQRTLWN